MTEAQLRDKVVKIMEGWYGCRESNGSHKKIIDIYNSHKPLARGYAVKYTDAWCATAVSAAFIQAGLTDIAPTECSCPAMINLFKNIGCWMESDTYKPQPGDIIMYDWEDSGAGDNVGTADHVGIVVAVSGNNVKVIEGNMSNAVGYRTLAIGGRYIRGYCLPNYSKKATTASTTTTNTSHATKSVDELAKEVMAGKWGNGADRKARLEAAGYNYNAVQTAVDQLVKGTSSKKSVETIAKEVIDGKWGNGATRKANLEAAGYNYSEVQAKVNSLISGSNKKSVTELAKEVIAGKWGTGAARKSKLEAAGYDYNAVQKKVNELM